MCGRDEVVRSSREEIYLQIDLRNFENGVPARTTLDADVLRNSSEARLQQNCDKMLTNKNLIKCDRLPTSNDLYNMVTTSFFDAIDKETKELLPRSIFVVTRYYKRVEIRQ